MYTIIKQPDGRYRVECMIQDGTERWFESNFADAIKSLKEGAWAMNHTKIKERDIDFVKLESVTAFKQVRCKKSEM